MLCMHEFSVVFPSAFHLSIYACSIVVPQNFYPHTHTHNAQTHTRTPNHIIYRLSLAQHTQLAEKCLSAQTMCRMSDICKQVVPIEMYRIYLPFISSCCCSSRVESLSSFGFSVSLASPRLEIRLASCQGRFHFNSHSASDSS